LTKEPEWILVMRLVWLWSIPQYAYLKEDESMNQVLNVMKDHRSIRNYLNKEVPEDIINELIEVAQAAPNSINGQQVSVIVVRDKQKLQKIAELAGNQTWIAQAPLFFLFIADFYKMKLAGEKVNKPLVITDSVEAIVAAAIDIGIAMQNVITAAESLGLGIVPIGGARRDPAELIRLLELPEYTFPMNGLVIGYPKDQSHKKPRMPKAAFRHDEVYHKEPISEVIGEYDTLMVPYLESVNREQEINWSEQTMRFYSYVYYPEVYPVMKKQGFKNEK